MHMVNKAIAVIGADAMCATDQMVLDIMTRKS